MFPMDKLKGTEKGKKIQFRQHFATEPTQLHSRPHCVIAFNTTAHAHMLILREGEGREFIVMADREKTSTKRSKESLIFIYAE